MQHIYFSGIGGTAIGPLALIAKQAGLTVSGSDKQDSAYIQYLKSQGIEDITIGQSGDYFAALHDKHPIDWLVYSSAVSIENANHPEITFARRHGIRTSKRDELLNQIITQHNLKLIAIAGTHGKTTTTAMVIWLFKELGMPVSYSVGAKIGFGDMGHFDQDSRYFVYECDEFDRNFLAFHPHISLITGIAYDHHEVFSTAENYQAAFREFLSQSTHKILWADDAERLSLEPSGAVQIISKASEELKSLQLEGKVNRENALLAINGVKQISPESTQKLPEIMNRFPGLSRRFERIATNLYSDYAHTPEKIAGCLEHAFEKSHNVVVVYEPLTNRRQYFIRDTYKTLFEGVKKLYWVPSYLTRENMEQKILSPAELIQSMGNAEIAEPRKLDGELKAKISSHIDAGDIVVCLSGGGGGSLDEWLRSEFAVPKN